MSLVSLKRTPAEMQEEIAEWRDGDPDPYGWGTRISLEAEDLQKLGMATLPDVGSTMTITGIVKVVSVSQSSTMTDDNRCVSLQITDMELGGAHSIAEEGGDANKTLAGRMYPNTTLTNNG